MAYKNFEQVRRNDLIYIVEDNKEYRCRVIDAFLNPKTKMIFVFCENFPETKQNTKNKLWTFRAAPKDFKWNNFNRFTAYTVQAAIGR